jgi:ABC-type Co2+ transport system permease subunit
LIVHALLFGDGGITAIGANCFNMAFAMPFAGYYIYRVLSYGSSVTSKRRVLAAGIAAYLGRFQNSSQKCPKINFRTIHGDSSERKNYAALRRILKASLFVYDHDYFCMAMRD